MTDLEKFVELYKSFGIECKVNTDEDGHTIYLAVNNKYEDYQCTISDKLDGYSDFFSTVEFDLSGNFTRQGFWE